MTCQRYSMFTPEDLPFNTPVQQGPTYRIVGGAERQSTTDGVITTETQAPQSFSAAQINPWHGTDNVLSTARSKNGNPVSSVQSDTLVRINGLEAPASFWAVEGYLQKGADGTYSEVQGGPKAAPEVADPDAAHFEAGMVEMVNDAISAIPQELQMGAMSKGIATAVDGEGMAGLIQSVATRSGRTPAESQARIEAVQVVYQAQADRLLTGTHGLAKEDLPDFYAWARTGHKAQLHDAVQKQVLSNNTSGYRALVDRYFSETAPTLQAIQKAGIPTRGQGAAVEIQLGGRWMSAEAAARAGFI